MSESLRYVVVKYVPDHVRYEPINIGCAVYSPDLKRKSLRITRQAGRLVDTRGIDAGSKAIKLLVRALSQDFESAKSEDELLSAFRNYGTAIEITEPQNSLNGPVDDESDRLYNRFVSFETTALRANSIRKPTIVAAARRVFHAQQIRPEERAVIQTPVRPVTFDFKIVAGADQLVQCISLDSKTGNKISEIEAFAHQAERVLDYAKEHDANFRLHAIVQPNRREPELNDAAQAILREVKVDTVENSRTAIEKLVARFGSSRKLGE